MNNKQTTKRQFTGTVVSDKMSKTVVVKVDRTVMHPIYRKRYTRSTKFKAHDEAEASNVGDMVVIEECSPISKDKRWRVIGKAK